MRSGVVTAVVGSTTVVVGLRGVVVGRKVVVRLVVVGAVTNTRRVWHQAEMEERK